MKKWRIASFLVLTLTISFMQVVEAKKAAPAPVKWTMLTESPSASFYYDENSIQPTPRDTAPKDIVMMEARTKVEVSDKKFVDFVNASNKKGNKAPAWKYLLMDFHLNMADRTYKCMDMNMFDGNDKLVEKRKIKQKFLPVPKKTFVEMVWNKGQEKVLALQNPPVKEETKLTQAKKLAENTLTPVQSRRENIKKQEMNYEN